MNTARPTTAAARLGRFYRLPGIVVTGELPEPLPLPKSPPLDEEPVDDSPLDDDPLP